MTCLRPMGWNECVLRLVEEPRVRAGGLYFEIQPCSQWAVKLVVNILPFLHVARAIHESWFPHYPQMSSLKLYSMRKDMYKVSCLMSITSGLKQLGLLCGLFLLYWQHLVYYESSLFLCVWALSVNIENVKMMGFPRSHSYGAHSRCWIKMTLIN